ncbi:unnamed protein product [Oreochromis niloticus]|nr:unnamed protein product [Mustela putorius furo]
MKKSKIKKSREVRTKKLKAYIPDDKQETSPSELLKMNERKILLVGKPGIGKTAVVHQMLKLWSEKDNKDLDYMFYFDMRETPYITEVHKLEDLLFCKFSEPDEGKDKVLQDLKNNADSVTIIFDGVTDVPSTSTQSVVLELIQKTLLPEAKIIVTCRPEVESADFLLGWDCLRVEVKGFSEQGIREYLSKNLSDEHLNKVLCNLELFSLCHVPMYALMVVACFSFEGCNFSPHPCTVTEIYVNILHFCNERNVGKTSENDSSQCNAILSLAEGAFCATEGKNVNLTSLPQIDRCANLTFLNRLLIQASPVLKKPLCAFLHYTTQEFFAALWLLKDPERIRSVVQQCLTDDIKHMKHLVPFLCGLLNEKNIDLLQFLFTSQQLRDTSGWFFKHLVTTFADCSDTEDCEIDLLFLCQCLYESQSAEACVYLLDKLDYCLDLSGETLDPQQCYAVSYIISQSKERKIQLNLEDTTVSKQGVRPLLGCLSKLQSVDTKTSDEDAVSFFLNLFCAAAEREQQTGEKILELLSSSVFQSAPAVWSINLSERKTSILLEVLKLQPEKKQVELTGCSHEESEVRSFLQCLPYISQLSVNRHVSRLHEAVRFFVNLFCAAAEREQQTGEKILELLSSSVFQSAPAVWSINLSERKTSILLEVLKLQPEKKQVKLTGCSHEESEVRSFLQCLPYISQLRTMEHMIEGIEGVRVYMDDIILWGSTLQQHNERLAKVLERVKRYGLKLNRAKCQFGVGDITFLGDKLTAEGIEPDKEKLRAILEMPCPEDKKGVLRILGMVNFIGIFIPSLAAKTVYLRQLLHNSCEFRWNTELENEWQQLKKTLTTEPVLAYFDPKRKTKVSTDASKAGIGAVLLQAYGDHWRPVAYASRAMTETESRYAQIEKETLGLVFGFEKFHTYVYGLPTFVAETDHKPLIAIIEKNLSEMSPRIQRLMMKLQRYDFNLIYTPDPAMYVIRSGRPQGTASRNEKVSGSCRALGDDDWPAPPPWSDQVEEAPLPSDSPVLNPHHKDPCVFPAIKTEAMTIPPTNMFVDQPGQSLSPDPPPALKFPDKPSHNRPWFKPVHLPPHSGNFPLGRSKHPRAAYGDSKTEHDCNPASPEQQFNLSSTQPLPDKPNPGKTFITSDTVYHGPRPTIPNFSSRDPTVVSCDSKVATEILYLDRPIEGCRVLLKIIKVCIHYGKRTISTYAIIDDGSESAMLLPEAAEKLGMPGIPEDVPLCTIRQDVQNLRGESVSFSVSSPSRPKTKFKIAGTFTAARIGLAGHTYPMEQLRERYKHLIGLPIHTLINVKPLLLIGSDHSHLVTHVEPVRLGPPGGPAAIHTRLGWALQGPASIVGQLAQPQQCLLTTVAPQVSELMKHVEKLWQVDIVPFQNEKLVTRSRQDQEAIHILETRTVQIEFESILRYATPLLHQKGTPLLQATKDAVMPSLRGVERRLAKDPERAEAYKVEMEKLIKAGSIIKCGSETQKVRRRAAEREQQTGEKILELLSSVCTYQTFPFNDTYMDNECQSAFLLDLCSHVEDCEPKTGLSVLPSLQSVFQSSPAVWSINLSERKTSILLEVLKLQPEKKQVKLTGCSHEEIEVRSFLQCLPYISQLSVDSKTSDEDRTKIFVKLFCAAVEREKQTGEKILELLSSVCRYQTFPNGNENLTDYGKKCQSAFLLDLYSHVKDYETKTGLSVLPSLQSVFQSAPAVWSINLSERKTSILLEVLKLQPEKKQVKLTGCSHEESEVRSFLQCLPYISQLRVDIWIDPDEEIRFFGNLFCAAAEREQQTGEKILELLSSVCSFDTFPFVAIDDDDDLEKYQCYLLLDMCSDVKDYETKTGLSVLPSLQSVFQSAPAVWSINLSERKTSILLEVLKLQPEKKQVELTGCSHEESEVRSFLQCLPYISQLSVDFKDPDEEIRFFVNLFCAAAEREQQTGETILELLSSVCTYQNFPYGNENLTDYGNKCQSAFLLDLCSHVKDYETKTGLSVLPSLQSVFQSAPAVWSINLSERKTSILLEVLKLQPEKKQVELTGCSHEESEVRSFLQCLPYISQLSVDFEDPDEEIRFFVNLFCAAAEREQQTGEKILELLSSVCRFDIFPFDGYDDDLDKYRCDLLLDMCSDVKAYESKTGLSVLPSLQSVFQSAPAVWSINLSERKTSILLEVLKLQPEKKQVKLTGCSHEESEVRSFLQCLPYISQLICDPEFFQSVCTSMSVRSREEAQQLESLLQLLGFQLLLTGELHRKSCWSVGRVLKLCGSKVDLILTPSKMSARGAALLFRHTTQLHSLRLSIDMSLLLFQWVRRGRVVCPLAVEELSLVPKKARPSHRVMLRAVSSLASLLRYWTVGRLDLTETCIPAQGLITLLLHDGPLTVKLSEESFQQLLCLLHEIQDKDLTLSFLSKVGGDLTSCCLNWELLHYLLQQSSAQTITVDLRKNLFLQEETTRLLPFLDRIVFKRPSPSFVMSSIRELYRAHDSHAVPSLLRSFGHVINLSCRELDSVDCAALIFILKHGDGVKLNLLWTSIPAEGVESILFMLDKVSHLSVDRNQLLRFIHCCAACDVQQEAASGLLRTLQHSLDLSCSSCVELLEEDQPEPLSLTADDCRAVSTILTHSSRDTQLDLRDCEVEDSVLDLLFPVLHRVRLRVSKTVLLQLLSLVPVNSERDTVRRAVSLCGALGGELDLSHSTLDQRACGALVQMLDSCEGLTELDLSHCQLTDQLLLPLIIHLHKVQVLDLSHNQITDASTDVLLQLLSINPSIDCVRLYSNNIVHRAAFKEHKQFEIW